MRVIETTAQLQAHVTVWQATEDAGTTALLPPLGIVLSMEGADPITRPERA